MLGINWKSLMDQLGEIVRWNKASLAKGSIEKKDRTMANKGKKSKAVIKRRRLRDIAALSRRQNRKRGE